MTHDLSTRRPRRARWAALLVLPALLMSLAPTAPLAISVVVMTPAGRPLAGDGRAGSPDVVPKKANVSALLMSLAACSSDNDGLTQQFREGSDKGFISGDGRVVEIPVDQRGEPVVFTGTTETGAAATSADHPPGAPVVPAC
mgnify:CR=1 FL=1